jgi:microcystin degradation protein MlrC
MVTTWQSPLKIAIDRAREIEREPGVLAATVLGGFPFADVPFAGVSTVVVTDGDPALARRYADELAAVCWERRADFAVRPTPVAEAIAEAMAAPAGSVYVLADVADSGASGTAGDGTTVLRGMLDAGARSAAVAQIMDREAVAACIAAGVGAELTLAVGGRHDGLHGPPVEVTGTVRLIHQGGFPLAGPMGAGTMASRGRTVVLEIGGPGGIELQLTELRGHPHDLNYFRAFGIEPTERRILVLKSAAHFRAAFEPIATKVIEVDAPGISSPTCRASPTGAFAARSTRSTRTRRGRPGEPGVGESGRDSTVADRRWDLRATDGYDEGAFPRGVVPASLSPRAHVPVPFGMALLEASGAPPRPGNGPPADVRSGQCLRRRSQQRGRDRSLSRST